MSTKICKKDIIFQGISKQKWLNEDHSDKQILVNRPDKFEQKNNDDGPATQVQKFEAKKDTILQRDMN